MSSKVSCIFSLIYEINEYINIILNNIISLILNLASLSDGKIVFTLSLIMGSLRSVLKNVFFILEKKPS